MLVCAVFLMSAMLLCGCLSWWGGVSCISDSLISSLGQFLFYRPVFAVTGLHTRSIFILPTSQNRHSSTMRKRRGPFPSSEQMVYWERFELSIHSASGFEPDAYTIPPPIHIKSNISDPLCWYVANQEIRCYLLSLVACF